MLRRPPRSTLFPYTRSSDLALVCVLGWILLEVGLAVGAAERVDAALVGGELGVRPHLEAVRSEEHTSELQSHVNVVCRLLLEKKKPSEPAYAGERREHGAGL